MSYTKTPPRRSLLYALEIPVENGRALGDTVFASAAAAFEPLPVDTQASLLGLRAIHRGSAKKYAPGSKRGGSLSGALSGDCLGKFPVHGCGYRGR
jgi:alpha-ketoglutarate-dependent taurine dioxygenase